MRIGSFLPWARSVYVPDTYRIATGLVLTVIVLLGAMPAARAQNLFTIEAEDFNYNSGQHQATASTMPYLGGAYNGMSASFGVDYFEPNDDGSSPEYRINESPNVPMTQNGDMMRGTWTMNVNYRIGWIGGGEWYNYTRNFPAGQYRVSAAISEASTNPSALSGSMQRITAGANTINQTVQQLGVFDAPGSGGWGLNNLVPLQDGSGNPVILTLNGVTTLRFTAQSGDVD